MIEDNSRISDRIDTEPADMENSTPPDGEDSQNSSEEDFDLRKEVISWLLSLAFVIVAVLIINNFIIVNAQVPSSSMENTIMPGNRLIGTRFSYWFSEPERGDIVIFHYPLDEK
ncbi:MAG: signal peptidase I, partial [Lachnospiraceae bacterium]|nr:signal peptidase I [Lachnospiraceae bacterium]